MMSKPSKQGIGRWTYGERRMGENSHNKERIGLLPTSSLLKRIKCLYYSLVKLNQVRQIAQSQHHYSSRLTSLCSSNTYLVLVYLYLFFVYQNQNTTQFKQLYNLQDLKSYIITLPTSSSPTSWQRQFQSRRNGIIHCKITRPLTNHCLLFSYISIF